MTSLTEEQERELRLYEDGEPRNMGTRPNTNLIRRNLLTLAPSLGHGWYRITESGQAVLAERTPLGTRRDNLPTLDEAAATMFAVGTYADALGHKSVRLIELTEWLEKLELSCRKLRAVTIDG